MSRLGGLPRAYWTVALGAVVGAAGGAAYAYFIGCKTGTCLLTGDVRIAALFFGVTGAIVGLPAPKKRDAAQPDPPQQG